MQEVGDELIQLGEGQPSYFGRLSVYPSGKDKYVIALYLQDLWIVEKGKLVKTLKMPLNHNLCKMTNIRDLKTYSVLSIPGMAGLIESRTKSNEDDD